MPQNSYRHPELPILAVLSQADPLREPLRVYARSWGTDILFFDHLCDAVSRVPLYGHGQTVVIVARPQQLSAAGIAAFGMLFGPDSLRYILWDDGSHNGKHAIQNACFVHSIQQFDTAVSRIQKQPDAPAPTPGVDDCLPKPVLSNFQLTEEEVNALLGATR